MFKAKTNSYYSPKWVCGEHFHDTMELTNKTIHYIRDENGKDHVVHIHTLCHSIGKTDRNAKMLYTKDIVKLIKTNGRHKICTIVWDSEKLRVMLRFLDKNYQIREVAYHPSMILEVVGNQIDNPYLLEQN